MQNLVLLTTKNDISIDLFLTRPITSFYNVISRFVEDFSPEDTSFFSSIPFGSTVYVRDPFNSGIPLEKVNAWLEEIFHKGKHEQWHYIDILTGVNDVYFEDKWEQYQKFSDIMPRTEIAREGKNYDLNTCFIKKRISSRAKGVVFDTSQINNYSEFIVQEKLSIKKEFRVFSVKGEIQKNGIVRSSKLETQKVKSKFRERIDKELQNFVENIDRRVPFDFVGYDIAELADNSLALIEINRSPQFKAYHRLVGENLAERLLVS